MYQVKLDLLPSNDNDVVLARKDIEVWGKGEEERPYLMISKADEEKIEECAEATPLQSGQQEGVDKVAGLYQYFSSLNPETQAIAEPFIFKYGKEHDGKMELHPLLEIEQITSCPMKSTKEDDVFNGEIPRNSDPNKVDYNSVLL